MDDNGTDARIEEALVEYLRDNPTAMDTLKAIAEWWVMRQLVRVEVAAVARVLARLTERGVVEVVDDGGERRYRLSPPPQPPTPRNDDS